MITCTCGMEYDDDVDLGRCTQCEETICDWCVTEAMDYWTQDVEYLCESCAPARLPFRNTGLDCNDR